MSKMTSNSEVKSLTHLQSTYLRFQPLVNRMCIKNRRKTCIDVQTKPIKLKVLTWCSGGDFVASISDDLVQEDITFQGSGIL